MKRTIAVELDSPAAEQVERAARYRHQSPSAFLAQASLSEFAVEHALDVEELMQAVWARNRAISAETGQAVEEIVRARNQPAPEHVEAVFLANSRTAAREINDPEFLQGTKETVAARRAERQRDPSSAE